MKLYKYIYHNSKHKKTHTHKQETNRLKTKKIIGGGIIAAFQNLYKKILEEKKKNKKLMPIKCVVKVKYKK